MIAGEGDRDQHTNLDTAPPPAVGCPYRMVSLSPFCTEKMRCLLTAWEAWKS